MGRTSWILVIAACVLVLTGCGPGERPDGPLRIVVSVPPLQGIAGEVGAQLSGSVQPRTIVDVGQTPHGFELTPEDARAIAEADIIVTVGLGIDAGLKRAISRSRGRVVEFAEVVGIEGDGHDHDHDHGGHDHHHGPVDAHLWLDPGLVERFVPVLAKEIAAGARDAGIELAMDDVEASAAVVERVRALDRSISERLSPFAGARLVTHHDALSRYAERYGLEVAAVIRPIETAEPTPSQIASALEAIRSEGATAIFLEPQFSASAAERIARQGGLRVGRIDPLGGGDWFETMEAITSEIVRVLGEGQATGGAGG